MLIKKVGCVMVMCVAVAALAGCPSKDSGGSQSANSSGGGSSKSGAPSGAYESPMPDGTTFRLDFKPAGAVTMATIEAGATNSYEGKWVLNGESILVEGAEGMGMQLNWKGDALVTDFAGTTLTFIKK